MEQQQKMRDGPFRCVCEEWRVSEHRRAQSPRWCTGLYQLAEIRWSGCGPHLVSQYSQFIADPLPHIWESFLNTLTWEMRKSVINYTIISDDMTQLGAVRRVTVVNACLIPSSFWSDSVDCCPSGDSLTLIVKIKRVCKLYTIVVLCRNLLQSKTLKIDKY